MAGAALNQHVTLLHQHFVVIEHRPDFAFQNDCIVDCVRLVEHHVPLAPLGGDIHAMPTHIGIGSEFAVRRQIGNSKDRSAALLRRRRNAQSSRRHILITFKRSRRCRRAPKQRYRHRRGSRCGKNVRRRTVHQENRSAFGIVTGNDATNGLEQFQPPHVLRLFSIAGSTVALDRAANGSRGCRKSFHNLSFREWRDHRCCLIQSLYMTPAGAPCLVHDHEELIQAS